jgi:predicted nucleic acid-binding protein
VQGGVTLVALRPDAMYRLVEVMDQFGLDFDDAYQYAAAEANGAQLVSFDTDFDGTDRRRTPGEIIEAV